MMTDDAHALTVARAYHRAWTSANFEEAAGYLADDLETDVPLNTYRSKAEWLDAVRGTRHVTSHVNVLAALGDEDEAILLYDMVLDPVGELRVAEHFAVTGGRITRIRQVHDTVALRAAGFAR